MGNIQDIIRIFSANILLAAKEDLSVKILAETLIINGLGGHQQIKEMTINNAVDYLAHHHKQQIDCRKNLSDIEKEAEKRAIDTQSEFLKQGIKETFKAQALLL